MRKQQPVVVSDVEMDGLGPVLRAAELPKKKLSRGKR